VLPLQNSTKALLFLSDLRGVSAMEAGVERTEPSPRPPAASAAATEAVLGDDDLLSEILLRLGFPTCLVRAAAVSKSWLRHASDPAFLRRFGDLNPPRLLGFYVTSLQHRRRLVDFVPMLPQPPELASVLRRGCFSQTLTKAQPYVSRSRTAGMAVSSSGLQRISS
jgi:hypothetical protein